MIFILLLTYLHAFHLSTSEINYDEASNAIQIASKVFIDDLELELSREGHDKLFIGTKKESRSVDSLLEIYFQKKLHLNVDGHGQESYYLGKELSDDLIAIWVYIEIPLKQKMKSLTINNTILTNLYDDQKNIVIVKKNNKMIKHSFLDKDVQKITINF